MLLPAVAVLSAEVSVAQARRRLEIYDDRARAIVLRRVAGHLFWYVLELADLRRHFEGEADDTSLESCLPFGELEEQDELSLPISALDRGVVLEGDRVVGLAEPGRESVGAPPPEPALEVQVRDFAFRSAEEVEPMPGRQAELVPVYFATDREVAEERGGITLFGGERGELRFGLGVVSIPPTHERGQLERPSFWRSEDPRRHVTILSASLRARDRFIAEASEAVEETRGRDLFLFIHGYRNSFQEALRRAAQLAHDLIDPKPDDPRSRAVFDVVPMLFSWPSQGELADYLVDETNARWAADHLEEVLRMALVELGARTVHVVAHSMGNRVLIEALRTLDTSDFGADAAELREVVFAAPDFDGDTFRDFADRFHGRASRFTLYASSSDRAIQAARKVHGGLSRAGESGDALVVTPTVETIDASAVREDFLAHSYVGGATVVGDLFHLLRDGAAPGGGRRALVREERGGRPYWRIPAA